MDGRGLGNKIETEDEIHHSNMPGFNFAPSHPNGADPTPQSVYHFGIHTPQGPYVPQNSAFPSSSMAEMPPSSQSTSAFYVPAYHGYSSSSMSDSSLPLQPTHAASSSYVGNAPMYATHTPFRDYMAQSPMAVVGNQGRRGLLPSTSGGEPPTSRDFVPTKNPDGSFSCPSCEKTYKHAKHVKRHFLRHTGEKTNPCKHCGQKFARTDVLKRHFQKCAARRGANPEEDHLVDRGNRRRRGNSASPVNDLPPSQEVNSVQFNFSAPPSIPYNNATFGQW